MDGNTDRSAGLESADSRSNFNHQERSWNRAWCYLIAAEAALEGCNKQEAQEARELLQKAKRELGGEEVEAAREG